MRYLPSDKYNVAWFKLAECVARGERERAFGLHRLLIHSFEDTAFATQLEGDIFLAFNEAENALLKYYEALLLYKESERIIEAAAIAEHILILSPDKYGPLCLLVNFYESLELNSKLIAHLYSLFSLTVAKNDQEKAEEIFQKLNKYVAANVLMPQREQLIYCAMKNTQEPSATVQEHICAVIQGYLQDINLDGLPLFLSNLKACNETYYRFAYHSLNQE